MASVAHSLESVKIKLESSDLNELRSIYAELRIKLKIILCSLKQICLNCSLL